MTEVAEAAERLRLCMETGDIVGARRYALFLAAASLEGPDQAKRRIAIGEGCRFLAGDAIANQRYGEATDWFLQAAAANPLAIEYRLELIYRVLLLMGFTEFAKEIAEAVTRLEPILAPIDPVRGKGSHGWRALAEINRVIGDRDGAEKALAKAAAACPGDSDVMQMHAILAADTGRFQEAEALFETLMKIPAQRTKALECYGTLMLRMCRFDDAVAALDAALSCSDVCEAEATWLRAEALLSKGDYEEGWKGHQRRLDLYSTVNRSVSATRFLAPMWKPGNAPERVHVHAEEGAGDIICMARYLPMLAALGHDVRFEVPDEMVDLFRGSLDSIKIVPKARDFPGSVGIEAFDSHIPSMSLPALFGTTVDTVPWSGPYLKADIERTAQFAPGIEAPGRIGLCWSAKPRAQGLWHMEFARRKSLRLTDLIDAGLFDLPYIEWASLQVGRAAYEGADYRGTLKTLGVAEVLPEEPTWADTAAVIATCDFVLTVDTGVAHLSGAMGCPGIVMMHAHPTWHFGSGDPTKPWYGQSIWYPGLKVVRQKAPNEWREVIDVIIATLGA